MGMKRMLLNEVSLLLTEMTRISKDGDNIEADGYKIVVLGNEPTSHNPHFHVYTIKTKKKLLSITIPDTAPSKFEELEILWGDPSVLKKKVKDDLVTWIGQMNLR